jgi:hypothetical protein
MEALAQSDPEIARRLRFLDLVLAEQTSDKLKKHTQQFVGANKCPSAAGCERLYGRSVWIMALLNDESVTADARARVLLAALEKLLPACDGADDRTGQFRASVRDLVQKGLLFLAQMPWSAQDKVDEIFHLGLVDQCTLVEPVWWWSSLVKLDREHALKLAAHVIETLPAIEPSHARTWKTLGARWTRLRLKSFLQFADDKPLLAQLLSRSAVDDFEAAQAVDLLKQTGRGRDALTLAERWHRTLPASPVLAWALAQLYLEDGWDQEALALITWQYERDPNPKWLPMMQQAAGSQWSVWQKHFDLPTTGTLARDD